MLNRKDEITILTCTLTTIHSTRTVHESVEYGPIRRPVLNLIFIIKMRHTMTLADGRKFWIQSFTGMVIDDRKWSETEVWSTSAPGYVDPKTGFSHGGGQKIHSQSYDMKEFWLKGADGTEEKIRLVDFSVDYRVGHVLTVVWGGVESNSSGPYFSIANHTIGRKSTFPAGNSLINLTKRAGVLKAKQSFLLSLLMVALFFSIIGIPILIVWVIWAEVVARGVLSRFRDQLQTKIDSEIYPHAKNEATTLIAAQKAA